MKKQPLITSLVMLCTAAVLWTGCSSQYSSNGYDGYQDNSCNPTCAPECPPVCPPACPPVCQPACPPMCPPACPPSCPPMCAPRAPVCQPVCEPCAPMGNQSGVRAASRITHDGIIVTVSQPQLCILGDNFVMDVHVQATIDVCEVVINAMLPDGVTLVRSEPQGPTAQGRQMTWAFDGMKRGECRTSRVTLRADREGDLCVCFCVTAVPVQFCHMLCAKPVLHCQKCGPECVCPGDPVHYTITVTNQGSCAAEEVVVTDEVPPELQHASGQNQLVYKLGTLQPCETKRINVCFTAVKRGTACNRILVTACNANQCSDQFCTRICQECVALTKTGPKEVFIGKNAEYQIVVTNTGDNPLTDVVVTDTAPSATSIVEAKGASICGNQAVWKFRELKPNEKQTLSLVLTTCTPGYYVNRVTVNDCQGCTASAEAGTRWKGRPALNAQIVDLEGSICVGDITTYTVRVMNQGGEEDTNVKLVVTFPAELAPLRASGPTQGTVSGQTVTFAPVGVISPRQVLEFRVDAQAKQSGDARVKIDVSSDNFKTPITQEESTVIN